MIAEARKRILIVEDDADMRSILRHNLEAESLDVVDAGDGVTGLAAARLREPDLIILDVMLPALDGYRLLRTLRAEGNSVPVLLLTARSSEPEKVYGFRSGADDYVTKPFGLQELLARVAALLRRRARSGDDRSTSLTTLTFGDVFVDVAARRIQRGGRDVVLTPRAYELLLTLWTRRNSVVPRRDLMRDVWGYADGATSRTLDAHIAELRRKLEQNPAKPRHILTAWRVGYKLVE